jgi:hypothetical protein
MPDKNANPVWLDDVESPSSYPAPRRLCIVSGDALASREFIAALRTVVGPDEKLQIIQDRRQGGSGAASARPPLERRRLPHVDALVKKDGYAIVPLPTSQPPHVPAPPIAARRIERRPAEPWPVERPRFARSSFDDDADTDERTLESILQFKRRHKVRLGPLLLLTALVGVLAVFLVQFSAVKTVMTGLAFPPPVERTIEPEAPTPRRQGSASLPAGGPNGPKREVLDGDAFLERLREAASTPRAQPDPASRTEAGPVPRPQTGTLVGVSPEPPGRVSSRPSGDVRAPDMLRDGARFPGLPRVELVHKSLQSADGKADSYVVRVWDPAGRPLAVAEVLLLAGMADGTVENVMLDAGPEPGTYTGTSRSGRSAPVNLRLRMTMSDKRIEIPVRP